MAVELWAIFHRKPMTMPDETRFRILSLDGGGLRGVYAASALSRLEQLTETPTHEHFDLIAGTSTGGIIAVALGLGIPASDVLDLYMSRGPEIFPKRRTGNLRMLSGPKHSSQPLEDVLREVMGDKKLGDSLTRLCVPATTATTGAPRVFKTSHHEDFKIDHAWPAWLVGMATSAAPFYLPGVAGEGTSDALIDGGLWANNPAMVGVLEAITYLGQNLEQLAVLSIGTGRPPAMERGEILRPRAWTWVPQIFSTTIGGQARAVHFQLDILRKTLGVVYHRLEPKLNGSTALDDPTSLERFAGAGDEDARLAFRDLKEAFYEQTRSPFTPCHGRRAEPQPVTPHE